MAYSNKKIPNDPSLFPAPMLYMTWVESRKYEWNKQTGLYEVKIDQGEGAIRHYHSLADARRSLNWIGTKSKYTQENMRGVFQLDWAVLKWDAEKGEWVEVYSGLAGQKRDEHPLWQIRFTKDQKIHPIEKKLDEKVMASIAESFNRIA